jgi:hypothetical protein
MHIIQITSEDAQLFISINIYVYLETFKSKKILLQKF